MELSGQSVAFYGRNVTAKQSFHRFHFRCAVVVVLQRVQRAYTKCAM